MDKLNQDQQKSLKTIAFLSGWMDTKFRIPGTQIKFGIDALMSLIPGIGDLASTGISIGIFALILKKGVPFGTAFKMMFNIILDSIFSSVPFIGTIADVGFKANTRNLNLLENHLANNPTGNYAYGIWMVFALTLLILGLIFFFLIGVIWKLFEALLTL
ncbi:MAG: hypothetical protein ACI9O4_002385 [Chitinophagales bacterium]|jgi:hypothetical protein